MGEVPMRGRRRWIALGLAIFVGAAVLGYAASRPVAPARLRAEVEQRLSELLGGPVRVGELRLSLGLGLRLEGREIEVWPDPGGPALRVEVAVADLRPFAHLTGQRRLSRLRIEGAELRVSRSPAGAWSPPQVAALLEGKGKEAAPGGAHPDELLRPLIALEAVVRALLTRTLVADRVELRDGRLARLNAGRPAPDGAAHAFAVEGIQLGLRHRRLRGDTRLSLRARLRDAAGERGSVEWEGRRSRLGELRIAVAATSLELEALAPFLELVRPEAQLAGQLSGAVIYETPTPGHGRLEVDLVGRDLHSSAPDSSAPWHLGPLEASRAELRGALSINPQHVRLEDARFSSDALGLQVDGVVERPLAASSRAQLALTIRDMTLAEVRHLIGWLPDIRREEAESLVAPLEVGHLQLLRAGGTATLSGWQTFLAGRTHELPQGFVVDAELAEAALRVGDDDRIEGLSGRLWWTGNRFELRNARARLNDTDLPGLDLSVEGVSNLFATHPEARKLAPGAVPLPGLGTLWKSLAEDDADEEGATASLRLEIDRLDHPMFLWPVRGATALVEPREGGVSISVTEGTWAGVPVRGDADWLFEPEPRVSAHFAALPPETPATTAMEAGWWAEGRFEVGPMQEGGWHQKSAQGSFRARAGEVILRDTRIQLEPMGKVEASGRLDLAQPDQAPFEINFALEQGDLSALVELFGLPREFASGRLDAAGSLRGQLRPEHPISRGLSGLLELEARDGTIQRAVPAVVVIALASEVFNPFARRDKVRFDRVHTVLEFEDGRLSSDGLSLDGPDVRAFASGGVDIARSPHPLDVELVLFLFRPVDSVIDKIPLLNVLLLGRNENLIAAHFTLVGPWEEPEANLVPLRSFTKGPGSLVFETLPDLMRRGLRAMEDLMGGDALTGPEPPPLPAAPPQES
jgi:hypothetical protein